MEDSPKSNIGCGFVALIPALIVLTIALVLHHEQKDWFIWAIILTGMLAIYGIGVIVVNGLVLAFGERSGMRVTAIIGGTLALLLGAVSPFFLPMSFIMLIPFIPIPYVGNVFLVIVGIVALFWGARGKWG